MAAHYEPEQKHMQGLPAPSYAPHPASTAAGQPRVSTTNETAEGDATAAKPNTQNKHQIEVKLSKVDPYRSAFPASILPDGGVLGGSFHHQGGLGKKQAMPGGGLVHGQDLAMISGQQ